MNFLNGVYNAVTLMGWTKKYLMVDCPEFTSPQCLKKGRVLLS